MPASPSRRDFLSLLAAGGGLGSAGGLRAEGPPLAEPSRWKKQGELFRYRGGVEKAWVQNFTSTVEALDGDRWRIWTSVSVPKSPFKQIGYHTGRIGGEWAHSPAVTTPGDPDPGAALAIGGLPEGWFPVQGVTLRLRDGRSRIYFWAHGEKVVRYLAADSEDGRAYRVVNASSPCLYHPADRCVGAEAMEEAGLGRYGRRKAAPASGENPASAQLIVNDATNVYQLPDGSFELYSVALVPVAEDDPRYAPQDNIPGRVRVVDRFTSRNGLDWSERRRVVEPDANDPVDLQFYYLSVTHTERGRVGLLGHYRLDSQTIDLEACYSSDGIHWERPQRRPWVERDSPGAAAGSYLLHAPHAMVHREGRWHLFYTGGNFAHNHLDSHGAPDRAIQWATAESLFR